MQVVSKLEVYNKNLKIIETRNQKIFGVLNDFNAVLLGRTTF